MNRIEQNFEVARLIARYLTESLTDDEQRTLEEWRQESPANEELFRRLCSEEGWTEHVAQHSLFDAAEGWNRFRQRQERRHRRKLWLQVAAVAAFVALPLLIVGVAGWQKSRSPQEEPANRLTAVEPIHPGKAQALLILDNGETVELDSRHDTLMRQAGHTLLRMDSAQLTYQADHGQLPAAVERPTYNRVETPRGGEYILSLSDGTRVHLNAMSSLRYPVAFGPERREVELIGEALFEVSKSETPFIVHTPAMQVEVLGTTFNLSAYPDEASQTTLVEGAVRLHARSGAHCLLQPSQQATWRADSGEWLVQTVDTDFYTSWAKGKILFKDQRLEDIMKTLSRWYGVEASYADEELKELRFGCHLNRYADIAPFVHLLEQTGKVHVEIRNRQIIFTH